MNGDHLRLLVRYYCGRGENVYRACEMLRSNVTDHFAMQAHKSVIFSTPYKLTELPVSIDLGVLAIGSIDLAKMFDRLHRLGRIYLYGNLKLRHYTFRF